MNVSWSLCLAWVALLAVGQCSPRPKDGEYDETVAKEYLKYVNALDAVYSNEYSIAEWGYESNITDANLEIAVSVSYVILTKFESRKL